MGDPTAVFFCSNHAGLPTARVCADCGRPFCESCLTELAGRALCGWCRDLRVDRLQPRGLNNPAAVILWARIYNGVSFLLNSAITLFYGAFIAFPAFLSPSGTPGGSKASSPLTSQTEFQVTVAVAAVITLFNALLYLPPALGLGPRRAWLWTWQLVVIVLSAIGGCMLGGMGSPLLVGAVVLGVFWFKPEVRRYCEEG